MNFWALQPEEIHKTLLSRDSGLSSREAASRIEAHGQNVIPDKDKRTWLDILWAQVASPLLLILVFASIVSAVLGDVFDTIIILSIVAVSVLLGFFQEYKSERVLSELKKYFAYHCVVLRDGEKSQIDSRELVPGDVVFVGLGDIIPADLYILETSGITVNESVLTGESREVRKDAPTTTKRSSPSLSSSQSTKAANPQEIQNGLFMGTTVMEGYAKTVVVATGKETFFGKTASVFSSKVPESEFQHGIRKFGSLLVKVISVMTVFIFLANWALKHGKNPIADSALFALAIAVGIAPEALPAVITLTLSSGSIHLAKKKVVTKKLAAIEGIGNMDILCTDKTGTLTEEGIRVEKYVDLDMRDSHDVFEYAFLCNAAVGTLHFKGNAIDVAIKKQGLAKDVDVSRFTKLTAIPFDFIRRRMGQVVREGNKTFLIVKGEPNSVLSVCSGIRMGNGMHEAPKKSAQIREMIAGYNKEGYSTIGVAYKEVPAPQARKSEYSKEDEKGLTFIGFILMSNPPKPALRQTLERLAKLNIRLKILTGDDALVTKRVCSVVGHELPEDRIILGSELEELDKEEFLKTVERYDAFARVTPEQKLAIVEALKENGHVVGFLGDGINDAPALRAADVGISVDTASDVAKGASHMILLKKSLGVVCDGVEEGRKIFGNITKYILNTMSANLGNMLTITISSLFLPFIPLLPSQILLNNLLSDVPLMSVSTDNVDKTYTTRPKKWDTKFILNFMLLFGVISTIFDFTVVGIFYYVLHLNVETFRTVWFLESVLSEMLIVFSLRTQLPFFKSSPSRTLLFSSIGAALLSLAVIYFTPIASVFYFKSLGFKILAVVAAILAAYFAATEFGKVLFFKPAPDANGNRTHHDL